MKTKTYTTIDRDALGWPCGPWDDEPDKMQWQDDATGLPCLAVRQPKTGHWCGYVGVPPGHPLHGKQFDDGAVDFHVHGGITYTDSCQPEEDESKGICHTPDPGEPDHVWWFGFDCAHAGDLSPLTAKLLTRFIHEEYRPLSYVQNECASLARQLAEVCV